MITIKNNILPFKGYKAMMFFGILFVRGDAELTREEINHEYIHYIQMKELLYVFFYVWYVVEWFVRLFMRGNAYRNISFEREAYANQNYLSYTSSREKFEFLYYLKKQDDNRDKRKES